MSGTLRSSQRAPEVTHRVRRFGLTVVVPAIVTYFIVCGLVLLLLNSMADEINRIDGDRGRDAVAAALDGTLQELAASVIDEGNWTEAFLNTVVIPSPAWLDETWGTTARNGDTYDTALVTDIDGRIVFGETVDGPLSGTVAAHFSGAAEMLAAFNAGFDARGSDAVVANFAGTGDEVAGLAVAAIHATDEPVVADRTKRQLLWMGRRVDDDVLEEIADRFQIPLPRLAAAGRHDEDVIPLADAAGGDLGVLAWHPRRPGDAASVHAITWAVIVMAVIGGLLFLGLAAFARSVLRRAEAEARAWTAARYDKSTELLTSFGLVEALGRLLQVRGESAVAMAAIGLEGLRDATSNYGEATSEAAVRGLIDAIRDAAPGHLLFSRLAPDELALVKVGDDAVSIKELARSVLELISKPHSVSGLSFNLGASIGVASQTIGRTGVPELMRMADAALQRARQTGGSHIVDYDAGIEDERQKRVSLQADIRRGLAAEEFDLHYQPIVDVKTKAVTGVEALMRWPRRVGGPLSPGEFIPEAEASGLIVDLGVFALRRATRDIANFPSLKLSVNVSGMQLRDPMLIESIDAALAENAFPAEKLQLEITESFLIDNAARASGVIAALRARGIQIALDDFGAGYSSIGYLRQFQFDRLKLDRSLVADIDTDPAQSAMVQSTLVFASAMGLRVTAEGVERYEEATHLKRLGCSEFQGFLFARPMPIDKLRRLMTEDAGAERKAG